MPSMWNNDEDGEKPPHQPSVHASTETGGAALMEFRQIKSVDWYTAKEMLITLSKVINLDKRLATFCKDTKSYPSQWKKRI